MSVLQVALAVIRSEAGVVWIERGRPPSLGRWALPGGRVEPGEEPLEAARRETLEETTLVVSGGRPLAVLTERFETTSGAYLYDVVVHVGVFDDPGGSIMAGDGVTAALRAHQPPAPALAPDLRLALLVAGEATYDLAARIRVDGDDLTILEWGDRAPSVG